MTDWDAPLDSEDTARSAFVWFARGLLWCVFWPLALLTPRERHRAPQHALNDRSDPGEETIQHGGML